MKRILKIVCCMVACSCLCGCSQVDRFLMPEHDSNLPNPFINIEESDYVRPAPEHKREDLDESQLALLDTYGWFIGETSHDKLILDGEDYYYQPGILYLSTTQPDDIEKAASLVSAEIVGYDPYGQSFFFRIGESDLERMKQIADKLEGKYGVNAVVDYSPDVYKKLAGYWMDDASAPK